MTSGTGEGGGLCAVCGIPAGQQCAGCQRVAYCGRDHQRQHWKELHRNECRCYQVTRNATLGRHLVATRAIRRGELIFRDTPLVLGPKIASVALCLGCHRNLEPQAMGDGKMDYYMCRRCGWPLCGQTCESSPYHVGECELLGAKPYRPEIHFDESDPQRKVAAYCAIVPLRAILLRRTHPQRFAALTSLESHVKERQQTALYSVVRSNLVPFICGVLGLAGEVNEQQLLEIAAIFDTNSYEIRRGITSSVATSVGQEELKIRALYELGAMIAHCCKPNTKHYFDESLRLSMVAAVDIAKGEVISISYTQPLQATLQRRYTIKQAKCFECGCPRCQDQSEFGTYAGSIVCPQCRKAMVVAVHPLDFHSSWRCENHQKCSYRESAQQYISRNEALRAKLTELAKAGGGSPLDMVAAYERLLNEWIHQQPQSTAEKGPLHAWNSNVLQIKYALTQLYGGSASPGGLALKELSEAQLRRQVDLCVELLAVADRLEPGFSPFRCKLLLALRDALVMLKDLLGSGAFESAPAAMARHPDDHEVRPKPSATKGKKPNGSRSGRRQEQPSHQTVASSASPPTTMKLQLEHVEQEVAEMIKSDPTLLPAYHNQS